MNKIIRIMVADDHSVVRQGLVALINRKRGMKVVAEAADGQTAVRQFQRHHPDVCLIDLRMPGTDGVEAIRSIRQLDSNAKIIVLTTFDDDEDIFRALRNGAKAYLLKDITREELIENILAVHRGKTFFPARVAIKLAGRKNSNPTTRELEVLRLLSSGKTNKEIGNLLGLKEGTIKIHINHILHKLGAETRTEASRIALKKGLISLD
jgi:two-component system, NarL family, response regulator